MVMRQLADGTLELTPADVLGEAAMEQLRQQQEAAEAAAAAGGGGSK